MKIKIGPHINWFGPYQLAEKLCFWVPYTKDEFGIKDKPDWVHDFGAWLGEDKNGEDNWITKLCQWIHSKRKRKIEIRIDNYDVWSMDYTLAMIILPMLKKLNEHKMGSHYVDPKDVPKHLRPKQKPSDENGYVDDTHHERWEWALNEMIWAFEQIVDDDNDSQFATGKSEILWQALDENDNKIGEPTSIKKKYTAEENAKIKFYQLVDGPNHTYKFDNKAYKKHNERIQHGTMLFGKYYRGLWD